MILPIVVIVLLFGVIGYQMHRREKVQERFERERERYQAQLSDFANRVMAKNYTDYVTGRDTEQSDVRNWSHTDEEEYLIEQARIEALRQAEEETT